MDVYFEWCPLPGGWSDSFSRSFWTHRQAPYDQRCGGQSACSFIRNSKQNLLVFLPMVNFHEGQPIVPEGFQLWRFKLWGFDGNNKGKSFLWEPSPSDVGIHPAASPLAVVHETEIVSPWSFYTYSRCFRLGAQEWRNLEETGQGPRFENFPCDFSSFTILLTVIMDPLVIGIP